MNYVKIIKSILTLEIVGFALIILLLWLDELIDLPHILLGAKTTPINVEEMWFETATVLILAIIVITISLKLAKRIFDLESLFPICVVCEKVCLPGADPSKKESWRKMDLISLDQKGSQLMNTLCPECREITPSPQRSAEQGLMPKE